MRHGHLHGNRTQAGIGYLCSRQCRPGCATTSPILSQHHLHFLNMHFLFFTTATEKNFLPGPGLEPGLPALRTETLALSHRSLHGTELDLLLVRRPFPPGKKKLDRTGIEPELPPSDLRALTIEPIHPFCHHAGTHSSRRTIGPSAQLPIVACSHIHDFFRTPFLFFDLALILSLHTHQVTLLALVFILFPAFLTCQSHFCRSETQRR